MGWKNILKRFRPPRTKEELLQRYRDRAKYGGYVDMEGNWNPYSGRETPIHQAIRMDRGEFITAYSLMRKVLEKEGKATLERLMQAAEKSTYIVSEKEIKAILDNSPDIKEKENGVYELKKPR